MVTMNFTEEEISQFQSLDDLEKEVFTEEEIKDLHEQAALRSQARQAISDSISKSIIQYMAVNKMGFNQFKKQLGISSASLSKILKGHANITLDTLSEISQATGMMINISFQPISK